MEAVLCLEEQVLEIVLDLLNCWYPFLVGLKCCEQTQWFRALLRWTVDYSFHCVLMHIPPKTKNASEF